jgi:hypothetical protein
VKPVSADSGAEAQLKLDPVKFWVQLLANVVETSAMKSMKKAAF